MHILGFKPPHALTTRFLMTSLGVMLCLAIGVAVGSADASAQSKRPLTASPPAGAATDAPAGSDPDTAAADAATAEATSGDAVPLVDSAIATAFVAARKAMLANDLERYNQAIIPIPRDHVLYGYIDYWQLRILLSAKRLEALTGEADPTVRSYLARHPGTLASDLLRRDWMLALGRRGDWAVFDQQYPLWQLRDESSPDCYAQLSGLARLAPGKALNAKARKDVNALLMRPVAMNRACADLFDGLTAAGQLQPKEIRARLMYALEANATADIRQTAALLGSALNEKGLAMALNRPATALETAQSHDLLLIALTRLARRDPEAAADRLQTIGRSLPLADRRFVWSQIAASGQRRFMPQAHGWAKEALGARVSDETGAWMARAALRAEDWTLLRDIILSLSRDEREEPTWVYWLGRVQKAQGHTAQAQKQFVALADRHDFYGKLAKEELQRPLAVPGPQPQPDAALVSALDTNPGILRAMAFYDLGMRFEGNREWNFQMRGRSPDELRAAAHWAVAHRLLDRAINTDERNGDSADFTLRFPMPFAEQLLPIAKEQNLDVAWVYGLIRQESRFVMDARSHVGASGLMQLMPATARWVAKKLGRNDFRQSDLNNLQTNLEFGSFYLKQALDDLDGSAVLASAGYNAGPRRARAWRESLTGPMEGAIFAEVIPFTETRGYVKNVLSNATDYAAILSGEPQSLKARLGTIEPRPAGVTQLP